jgi:hypothetical protein
MKKLLLLLLLWGNVHAQDTIQIKKSLDLSFGLMMNGGNNPLYGGSLKPSFSYESSKWEYVINPNLIINYASVDDKISLVRREGYLVTTVFRKYDKWKLGAISEVEHSFLKKIDIRFNAGAGPSFKLIKNREFELSFSEYVLVEGVKVTDMNMNNYVSVRTSSRIKAMYIRKSFSVSSINLVQPVIYTDQKISTADLFIFRTINKIDFNVAKSIALGIQLDGRYDAYPTYLNNSILPFDWTSVIALTYRIE